MTDMSPRYPDLTNRVAVVTGGSRGIGAGIATALAAQGVAVAISGRDKTALHAVAAGIERDGGTVHPVLADVTDPDALHRLHEHTERVLGNVDLIAAVAGGQGAPAKITEMSPQNWRDTVDVNLTSVFLTLREFLPGMIDRRRGSIVTISSTAGQIVTPASPAYSAAKAGLLMLTKQAATQVIEHGIRINAISPGGVINDKIRKLPDHVRDQLAQAHPRGRIGIPSDVAAAAVFLLSDAATWLTGTTVDVNGGQVMT